MIIISLHNLLGNRWSLIARKNPGRTDNEIKNYWNTRLSDRRNNATAQMLKPKAGKPSSSKDTALPMYSSVAGTSAEENLAIKEGDSNAGTGKETESSSSYRSIIVKKSGLAFQERGEFHGCRACIDIASQRLRLLF